MTESHDELSFVEQVEADPRGRAELAVAKAQLRLEELLQEAIRDAGDVDYEDLSKHLGVSPERVQRIFDGEDPLRFEAFIRYVSVLGRTVRFELNGLTEKNNRVVDHFEQVGASAEGMSKIEWHREAADFEVEGIEPPRYTGTTWTVAGHQFHGAIRNGQLFKTYRLKDQSRGRHVDSDATEVGIRA